MDITGSLTEPTPVEEREGRLYKRDDLLRFSNGVNGKVRTSLWLAQQAQNGGASGLVYGGSVKAPALGRVASAAAYSGMDCYLVIGSGIETARRHPTVAVAEQAGAQFLRSKVAYNPALQKMARETAEASNGYLWQVPYGVSTPASWSKELVRAFLEVDASQVTNLPDRVKTLVVPFGSGNAAAAVLYGLARSEPLALEQVILAGVGPDRSAWLRDRLEYVGVKCNQLPFRVLSMPLHPHFAEYDDQMPESLSGINFHPTYEGKIIRFLNTTKPDWWTSQDGTTCMWIVGGPL